MVLDQSRSHKKKSTGGRKRAHHGKRKRELGRPATNTQLGEAKKKTVKVRGNVLKNRLRFANKANVYDPVSKKFKVAGIITVQENSADRNFARRNIMTKGAIIKTDIGSARVTSRPGQTGTINAILLQSDEAKKIIKEKKHEIEAIGIAKEEKPKPQKKQKAEKKTEE